MSVGEDDAEQFSLRWNNFHNNLTVGFHELLEEEDLVDVTLACDGKYVQAHKIVLSVCSPYFKSLFKENPCRHPIVILKDVGHKELQAILQFMYRGEVNVRQDDLTGFLKTAEMLKIKGLTGENSEKDSQKKVSSEEKRRQRVTHPPPTHCEDEPSPVPYKRVKPEQRRSRVVPRSSSRPHSPTECIPVSSASREELLHSEFDVTKPKEEPVDYSQVEDEYSSELASSSLPHDIEEGMEDAIDEEGVVEESRSGGMGRNHLPGEGQSEGPQSTSALAAMAHLVHVGGPSSSDGGQRQDSRGLESKQAPPPLGLPPIGSGAVLEPNVALQVDSEERRQGVFPGSYGFSQDSSSSQDVSQESPNGSVPLGVSPADLQRHLGYKCSICQKYFTRRDHLKTHTKNLHGEDLGPFACIICSQLYKNADSLRKHIGKYHVIKTKYKEDV